MLTESQRKWLTEYLGECWHNTEVIREYGKVYKTDLGLVMVCTRCLKRFEKGEKTHRTFTTWADLGAVKEAIERKGEWGAFLAFSWDIAIKTKGEELISVPRFTAWLINPSRLPELVCQWKGVE